MPNSSKPAALSRLLIPALLLSVAAPALAQLPNGSAATTSAPTATLRTSTDPAELLAQALRTLATEPGNLAALTAAGQNAVILGDPNAAVGFFGKAQEIAPNDGRVKAGLGSALVELEKPQDALRLFAEASRLGVPQSEFAEDRGLAYDLTGDQARAQADYQMVLAAHPDDDTARRRLALSQGIAGQKAAAIATLDPLIRKRDIAGWRAQTFVLAMDGDAKGANDITRVMLPQQAAMLQPFLVRLATLSPADKARAVHFGEMPATGATYTPTQVASVSAPATYASAPPRSDLALPPVKTPPASTIALPSGAGATTQIAGAAPPQQVAAATPKPRDTRRPAGVSINDRDQIFALGQPRYVAAPLAGIALTPAKPAPQPITATPSPASEPAVSTPSPAPQQVAQAAPLSAPLPSNVAGPPAPPADDLPMPAAQGHYDLPHDAATGAPREHARAVAAPAPVKTVGTPVVHGSTATASADAGDTDMKKSAKAELATADDGATKPKTRAGKAASAGTLAASTDDDDCGSVTTTRSKSRSKSGVKTKPSTACTRLASADDDGTIAAKPKSASAAKAKTADTDADDCAPATKSKAHGKAAAKKNASTACAQVASADDGTSTMKKGAKAKASAVDDADATRPKSSKSAKSATADDRGAAGRVYVQVAGGANKDDMDKAWAGVKAKAPDLMKGRSPSTTPLKSTNRLLVGPFKDEAEAQAFVNKMSAKGLSGFTFKSGKGQKVDKLGTGG